MAGASVFRDGFASDMSYETALWAGAAATISTPLLPDGGFTALPMRFSEQEADTVQASLMILKPVALILTPSSPVAWLW